MKVAIVCDWLTGIGGAERVVLELHKMYPDAPIYTSQYDPKKIDWFKDADVRTTWLQKLPKGLRKFLPVLRSQAFSRLNLQAYDLVISSSGAEAKGVKTRADAVHISYIHAPTHYYWSRYDQYIQNPGFGALDPLARLALKLLVGPLRRRDFAAAQRPDYLIANSSHIQSEIRKYYGRESEVIHPPVDLKRFAAAKQRKREGFVVGGRQTPYKRIDLAVAACNKVGEKLTVIGDGPEHERLKAMAGPSIKLLGEVAEKDVPEYFQSAEAFIFPGLDDFGITPVEAMAAGTPVIAYKAGGALDYVVEGKTGLFFDEQDTESLSEAILKFRRLKFSPEEVAKHAEAFSVEHFHNEITHFVNGRVTKT